MNNAEFQAQAARVEQLVQRASGLADENARTLALDLLQSLMDLHGGVMSRIVEVLAESGEAGRTSLAKLGSDPLICGLLVLYGVHPVAFEDRVTRAVEQVRPPLHKQGATVELIAITDSMVRVKVQSGSSSDATKRLVEQAILEAAPEVMEIIVEGAPVSASGFVPVNMIQPALKKENKYEESAA
jgi:Fe-S cluster biogenesis protein NfuA